MDTFLGTPLPSLFFPDPQTQSRVPCVLQGPGQGRGLGQDHGVASATWSPGAMCASLAWARCHPEGS